MGLGEGRQGALEDCHQNTGPGESFYSHFPSSFGALVCDADVRETKVNQPLRSV